MAKKYFYVAGDDKKTPVDITKQAPGTDLVCVFPSDREVAFKAGEKFKVQPIDRATAESSPEAQAEKAVIDQQESARTAGLSLMARRAAGTARKAVSPASFYNLPVEVREQKIADAKAKAAALKEQKHVAAPLTAKSGKSAKT